MAQNNTKATPQTFAAFEDEAVLSGVGAALSAVAEEVPRVVLRLDDLMEDANGEVVLYNDSHLPSLALETGAKMVASGEIEDHRTATGEDVSGFNYLSFDTGVTIYYKDEVDLLVVEPAG